MTNVVKLEEICNIKSGGTPARYHNEYWKNGEIPWVKISDIKGKYLSKTVESITEEGLNNSSAKMFSKGTILYTIFATLGEVCFLDIDASTNQAIAGLEIISDDVYPDYLYYYLISKKEYVKNIGRGVAQNNINLKILKNMEIPLPCIEKQKNISIKVEEIGKLIDFRKQQLSKLDELVKSRFVEMFGDVEVNSQCWNLVKLGDYIDVIGGYAFKSKYFIEYGIPVLRIGNINSGCFKPVNLVFWENDISLDKYKVYPGDIVMSLTGTVGKDDYGNICILSDDYEEYYLNQRNAKLKIKSNIDKIYLSELLKFPEIKKKLTGISRGVRQANISNKDILNLVIPLPPIQLQNKFAEFVEQVEKSKQEIQQSLEKLETLKKSLMQEYFG